MNSIVFCYNLLDNYLRFSLTVNVTKTFLSFLYIMNCTGYMQLTLGLISKFCDYLIIQKIVSSN